jgi:ATP-dependent helicase/nuclease subunit A
MGDWISYALARCVGAEALCNEHKLYYNRSEGNGSLVKVRFDVANAVESDLDEEIINSAETAVKVDDELMDKLKNRYADGGDVPVKMSVSEAKRRQSDEEYYSPHIFTIPMLSASDISMLSATDKGTIMHFVLQHIDFGKTGSVAEIEKEVSAMAERGIISPVQKASVDIEAIARFFDSNIGKRLKNAKEVHKEFSFYSKADAGDFYSEQKGKSKEILLQGTMDCFFVEENGNIVLLDYKTDKVDEASIKSRAQKYFYQLSAYKKGLEEIAGQEVNEAYICFLSCGKNISLEEIEKA